ncbi:MAG: hypothetical protein ACTS8W_01210 [Arsenophonus sp. NC-PY1-MAG3]
MRDRKTQLQVAANYSNMIGITRKSINTLTLTMTGLDLTNLFNSIIQSSNPLIQLMALMYILDCNINLSFLVGLNNNLLATGLFTQSLIVNNVKITILFSRD